MSEQNSVKTLRLILGDQLNAQHSWFQTHSEDIVYVIAELKQEATYTTHHIQKACAFFLAMENFANALIKAGHKVLHLTLDDTCHYSDLPALLNELIKSHDIDVFEFQLPDEYRLRQQLYDFAQDNKFSFQVFETEHFYLSDAELSNYFKANTSHRLESFYRKMRVRFDLLMEGEQPEGGQWNFDKDNRNKFKATDLTDIPMPFEFNNHISQILERLERHEIKTIGKTGASLLWPVDRKQTKQLLEHFCHYCLAKFGRFQDAMTRQLTNQIEDNGWSLYHSRLSFSLNAKIVSPKAVVNHVIDFYKANYTSVDIAQVEGFVRQILGWREFVRGIYWANMPNYQSLNHLNAHVVLPSWFWNANTKMKCLQHAIKQSLDFAYAHHIQRLMVTGNFCLLAGISPDQVDDWYLGIYIDAVEWVEMPNTRGMSQFADGGIVGSKAYAASGNYINKMSDYCSDCQYSVKDTIGEGACPLNSLYWRFMNKHEQEFSLNPRQAMVYRNWQKKPDEQKQKVLHQAEIYIKNIESL
jgi:deoxyribodipyrimidine photolyase-related protein